ncbi:acyl-CoA thioesterase [Xenophilus arseniciresistens]|uniref:Acyl-CoA thioesterase n=1 Tax=Xenophilus arseniciresistens TaxID=1283306 RepID=A0AAE3NAH6_9BURK|nr:hotdog domain-containing protein [Xenophilus arseniciresistens]MDA7417311.1 acyl-CoA thioesterase [Xenophilus arseniciresistens]
METPQTVVSLEELVLPALANHHGTLFAGQGLQLMAKAAYLAARAHARRDIVMAGVKSVDFLRPVPVGHTLTLRAQVVRSGRASMTVRVLGSSAAVAQPAQEVLQGEFELVAIDADGRPATIQRDQQDKENTHEQSH